MTKYGPRPAGPGRRRVFIVLLVILALGAALLLGRSALAQWQLRPVRGRLVSQIETAGFTSGSFRIQWDAESEELRVYHKNAGDRALWKSRASQPFIALGRGEAEVHELRSHYDISDNRRWTCADQRIASIEQGAERAHASATVRLRGTLGCDDGREVTYELSFRADGERHLTFELSSDEPDINRSYLSYAVAEDAHILGFGAQFTHLDMQDRRVPIIVEEQGIGRGAQPITLGADLQAGAGGDAL